MAKSSSKSRKRTKSAKASSSASVAPTADVSSSADAALDKRNGKSAKPDSKSKAAAAESRRTKAPTRPTAAAKPGKVIRDSFTMPASDYKLIRVLKERCLELGMAIKKSELLRAGLALLQRLPKESLSQAVAQVDNVKIGRPPKSKQKPAKEKRA